MKKKIKYLKFDFKKKFFWLENLILVTGTHTSGKSMISPVIASLKKVEILRKIYYLDQLANLNFFKKLPFKTAKFMANHILDLSYYEQLIGRNMNFRYEDETSVAQSKDPMLFKKRLKIKRGEHVLNIHKKKNTHMLLDTHDGIWFYKFWLNLGIKNLKIINISRNPIDVVNSWLNSEYGEAEKQILCQIPLISHKKKLKPFYFYNDIDKKKLNKYDTAVNMVCACIENELKHFKKINHKRNLIRIDFDNFAENTNTNISKICSFLKTSKTVYTNKIMKRENLPRKILEKDRLKKKERIKKLVSPVQFKKLLKLEKLYIKKKNLYKW